MQSNTRSFSWISFMADALIITMAAVGAGIVFGEESHLDDSASKAREAMTGISGTILIAEDETEWPPFLFTDKNAADNVGGASVDLVREALVISGYKVKVERYPWERAKRLVEEGQNHIMNNASSNTKRMQTYHRTLPLYQISHAFFYLEERFPYGPAIGTAADIDTLNIAGMRGYNYDIYEFDTEKINKVDMVESLFQMLRAGRVDLIIGYPEIYNALAQQGKINLTGMKSSQIIGSKPLIFYSWVSRNIKTPEKLLADINMGLTELEDNGRKKAIFAQYGLIE